ncbi:diguanylate cyclase (GGDEF)-like protein/PAS domain S-box-containing protein [Salirhabdus euzebyi]|uniref:Diguanylate cyclase (GGDEF)-like protein/PAS domain S-box-containing protein n=1 Tax=Salirhabdus euzebyi TaxID=394506 RepID=A0A841Q4W2_9BACI|nr:bifunctional diguanylate cyclase/phosphodiesterase [Salirhabdus euzebyi]MBB6453489.1 diguanylate cyclase (GGDEF)-like protein/PAS domain S-box-containing protein [Salirhabdus euzebyi]
MKAKLLKFIARDSAIFRFIITFLFLSFSIMLALIADFFVLFYLENSLYYPYIRIVTVILSLILATFILYLIVEKVLPLKKKFTFKENRMEDFLANEVLQNIKQGIAITDYRGTLLKVNKAFADMTGHKEHELIGSNFVHLKHFLYPQEFFKDIIRIVQKNGKWQGEILNKREDGQVVPEYLTIYQVLNELGKVIYYFGIFVELKEIKEKEKALWDTNNRLQAIFEDSPLGIIVCDLNGNVEFWNRQAEKILKHQRENVINQSISNVLPHFACQYSHHQELITAYKKDQNIINTYSANGEEKTLQLTCTPLHKQDNELSGFQMTFTDITDFMEAERHIEYLKKFDRNTGLYNYDYFYQYISNQIEEKPEQEKAVMLMDVDRFGVINKKFGNRFGDKAIEEVGKKIHQVVGSQGIVSKLKGDEFGVFLDLNNKQEALDLAKAIFTSLYDPLIVDGQPVHITLSIGIGMYPNDGFNFDQISKAASLALSRAKRERNVYKLYDASMHDDSNHFYYENELHKALKKNELNVHYQPQIDLKTNELFGVEALVRWEHGENGNIPPNIFIPIAEESGLIAPLTSFVIHRVCQDYLLWKKNGFDMPAIAINISAKQFFKKDFAIKLIDILNHYHIPKDIIHLEITESVVMDIENSMDKFHVLKQHGIKISIDDFGTGYSSLKYLQELPIDYVKIDKAFIRKILENNMSMVDFIIHIAVQVA